MIRACLALLLVSTTLCFRAQAAPEAGEPLAKLILREFDTNSDGTLDTGEWHGGISASYERLDANGDDSLAPSEVDELRADIASESGEVAALVVVAVIKVVLLSLDKNNDQLISREEYGALTEDIFKKLDQDDDGALSITELAELPLKLAPAKAE